MFGVLKFPFLYNSYLETANMSPENIADTLVFVKEKNIIKAPEKQPLVEIGDVWGYGLIYYSFYQKNYSKIIGNYFYDHFYPAGTVTNSSMISNLLTRYNSFWIVYSNQNDKEIEFILGNFRNDIKLRCFKKYPLAGAIYFEK